MNANRDAGLSLRTGFSRFVIGPRLNAASDRHEASVRHAAVGQNTGAVDVTTVAETAIVVVITVVVLVVIVVPAPFFPSASAGVWSSVEFAVV